MKNESNACAPLTETEIARRAYSLWQADGCCDGKDQEHWHKARELLTMARRERPENLQFGTVPKSIRRAPGSKAASSDPVLKNAAPKKARKNRELEPVGA